MDFGFGLRLDVVSLIGFWSATKTHSLSENKEMGLGAAKHCRYIPELDNKIVRGPYTVWTTASETLKLNSMNTLITKRAVSISCGWVNFVFLQIWLVALHEFFIEDMSSLTFSNTTKTMTHLLYRRWSDGRTPNNLDEIIHFGNLIKVRIFFSNRIRVQLFEFRISDY